MLTIEQLPKEIQNRAWVVKYLKEINAMNNEDLIDEALSRAVPDGYDGCFSTRGYWEGRIAAIALHERCD